MSEEKSVPPQPTLPQIPDMKSVWGDQNSNEEDLVKYSKEMFEEVVKKFGDYTEAIRKGNDNFLLKQGRLLVNNFRQGIVEGMIEGIEKSIEDTGGIDDKLAEIVLNLHEHNKFLEEMIQKQEQSNVLAQEAAETDQEEATKKKAEKTSEKEEKREGFLRKFFLSNDDKKGKGKGTEKDVDGGILSALFDKLAFIIPAAKLLIPLLGGLGLFFIDFEAFAKNPMWEKVSSLIKEKLIPGVAYLIENVFGPLTNFLANTTLPAVISGIIEAVDDFVVLVKDIIEAFNADTWKETISKVFKAVKDFFFNFAETIFDTVVSAFGYNPEEVKSKLKNTFGRTWDSIVNYFNDFFDNVTILFGDIVDMVSAAFEGDWKKAIAAWGNYIGHFAEFIKDSAFGLLETFVNLVKDVFGFDGEAFDTEKFIQDAVGAVTDFAKNLVTVAIDGIKGFFGGIRDWVADTWVSMTTDAKDSLTKSFADGNVMHQKIKDSFWGLVDSMSNAIVSALTRLKDFFVALPDRIWRYVLDQVKSIKGGEWLLGQLGIDSSNTSTIQPIDSEKIRQDALANNEGTTGFKGMVEGMNKFSSATDRMKDDVATRDKGNAAPIILSAPQVNQSSQTNVSGPSYMSATRSKSDRSFFGAK